MISETKRRSVSFGGFSLGITSPNLTRLSTQKCSRLEQVKPSLIVNVLSLDFQPKGMHALNREGFASSKVISYVVENDET